MNSPDMITCIGVAAGVAVVGLLGLGMICVVRWAWPRSRPPTQDSRRIMSPWILIMLVGTIGLLLYLNSGRSGQPSRSPDRFGYIVGGVVLLPVCTFGVLILAQWIENRAVVRANKLANRGDVDGAIAGLVAVVDRQRSRKRSLDPSTAPRSPWTPPRSSAAGNKQLANRLNALGALEGMRDDWTKALNWFREAEQASHPALASIYVGNQGTALVKLGRPSEGIPRLRQAVDRVPESDPSIRYQILVQLVIALIDLKRTDEARTALDRAEEQWSLYKVYPASTKKQGFAQIETLRAKLALDQIDL